MRFRPGAWCSADSKVPEGAAGAWAAGATAKQAGSSARASSDEEVPTCPPAWNG